MAPAPMLLNDTNTPNSAPLATVSASLRRPVKTLSRRSPRRFQTGLQATDPAVNNKAMPSATVSAPPQDLSAPVQCIQPMVAAVVGRLPSSNRPVMR